MVVDFDIILHEGYIRTRNRSILYFILQKSIFIHFVHHDPKFYGRYINSYDSNIYIDDYWSGVKPKTEG